MATNHFNSPKFNRLNTPRQSHQGRNLVIRTVQHGMPLGDTLEISLDDDDAMYKALAQFAVQCVADPTLDVLAFAPGIATKSLRTDLIPSLVNAGYILPADALPIISSLFGEKSHAEGLRAWEDGLIIQYAKTEFEHEYAENRRGIWWLKDEAAQLGAIKIGGKATFDTLMLNYYVLGFGGLPIPPEELEGLKASCKHHNEFLVFAYSIFGYTTAIEQIPIEDAEGELLNAAARLRAMPTQKVSVWGPGLRKIDLRSQGAGPLEERNLIGPETALKFKLALEGKDAQVAEDELDILRSALAAIPAPVAPRDYEDEGTRWLEKNVAWAIRHNYPKSVVYDLAGNVTVGVSVQTKRWTLKVGKARSVIYDDVNDAMAAVAKIGSKF